MLNVEPENQPRLLELLRDNTDTVVTALDGWISTSFIAAKDGRQVAIYSLRGSRLASEDAAYQPRGGSDGPGNVSVVEDHCDCRRWLGDHRGDRAFRY